MTSGLNTAITNDILRTSSELPRAFEYEIVLGDNYWDSKTLNDESSINKFISVTAKYFDLVGSEFIDSNYTTEQVATLSISLDGDKAILAVQPSAAALPNQFFVKVKSNGK